MSDQPVVNTDREIYRGPSPCEWGDDDRYYADSIHVTESGGIGFNCGGHVIVMPLRKWFEAAQAMSRHQVGTMPQRPPMAVLEAIVLERRLETHARGKDVQRRYGVDVVPPNYELEHAAGLYDLIRETLLEFVACTKQEGER